ncbi:hypothetical protein CKO42_08415 [Lamprobacter modestohalophilus]|uniref:YfdX family protein n=1 Tax=Lamprobacter modestohalophilus TaxID=1064514 RepID=A0A9X0W7M6_9GAMM|nr:hypothetical protein [Lamprobacter modestohalophilus]MBK1618459.1 hypothetical protein [Lamprobacter modestohalophilus]
MKMRPFSTGLIAVALMVLIPATTSWATTRDEAEATIAEAKDLREKAVAAGVSDSLAAEMIDQAESLLPSRQYTLAQQYAYWAMRQDQFAMKVASGEVEAVDDKAAIAESMIAAAEVAREKADAVGGEWRDVADMIKSAKTFLGAGEFDQAIQAASAAKFQAVRGYEQAMAEQDADMPVYMREAAN